MDNRSCGRQEQTGILRHELFAQACREMGRAEMALGLSEPASEIDPADHARLTDILLRYASQIAGVLK